MKSIETVTQELLESGSGGFTPGGLFANRQEAAELISESLRNFPPLQAAMKSGRPMTVKFGPIEEGERNEQFNASHYSRQISIAFD